MSAPGVDAKAAQAARLLELREAERKRQEARAAQADEAELELLELVDKYERELGPRGQAFDILDVSELGEGFVVVALGNAVQYAAIKESKVTDADVHTFVVGCLKHPSAQAFADMCDRRPIVRQRAALLLHALYGDKAAAVAKKV